MQRFHLAVSYPISHLSKRIKGGESTFTVTCFSATLRPTLFLSSILWQRNAFLTGYNPASKQAGMGRMWVELGIYSTPPRDQSSLTATTNAKEKDGNEGLSLLWCLSWLLLGQHLPGLEKTQRLCLITLHLQTGRPVSAGPSFKHSCTGEHTSVCRYSFNSDHFLPSAWTGYCQKCSSSLRLLHRAGWGIILSITYHIQIFEPKF